MFVARPMHREHWEVARWFLVIALAGALALVLASQMADARDGVAAIAEPQRLSATVERLAQPLSDLPAVQAKSTEKPNWTAVSRQLWLILDDQRSARTEAARDGWQAIALPPETAAWREIGLAVTHLQLADFAACEQALDRVERVEPDQPLLHYYRALLHLEIAIYAPDYYDAIGPQPTRLASYSPQREMLVTPYTASMHKLIAMQELETAILHAGKVLGEEPLVPSHLTAARDAAPTVNQMLAAWGADNFVGKSHNMLGSLCLERGWLERAEEHMDQSQALGVSVVFGYRDLGQAYEANGRYGDAMRAYAKSLGHDPSLAAPAREMLRNLGRAWGDMW